MRIHRDYFFIKDAVLAHVMLAEQLLNGVACGEAYNFSNESPASARELVALISELMGCADVEPVILNEATNEIPHQYLSAEPARTRIGWTEGLRQTIGRYRGHFDEVDGAR